MREEKNVRLSERVAAKIEMGIEHLSKHGVLLGQRMEIDYEPIPVRLPSPDGNGYITSFFISLAAPSEVLIGDHVIHDGILYDPYIDQESVDALIWEIYEKVLEEKAEAAKEIPPAYRKPELRTSGGLIVPGKNRQGT